MQNSDRSRIVIAVTDPTQVRSLWVAAMRNLGELPTELPTELLTLYVDDNRWHRAASLPFTREISRIGGSAADFNPQRAEQVSKYLTDRVARRIGELADESGLAFTFKVLSEPDSKQIEELAGHGRTLLIAPSFLTIQPIYAYFEKLEWRIELIEIPEENHVSQ